MLLGSRDVAAPVTFDLTGNVEFIFGRNVTLKARRGGGVGGGERRGRREEEREGGEGGRPREGVP